MSLNVAKTETTLELLAILGVIIGVIYIGKSLTSNVLSPVVDALTPPPENVNTVFDPSRTAWDWLTGQPATPVQTGGYDYVDEGGNVVSVDGSGEVVGVG